MPKLRTRKLRHDDFIELDSTPLTPEARGEADAVAWIVGASRLVIDTRNATRGVERGREKIVRA